MVELVATRVVVEADIVAVAVEAVVEAPAVDWNHTHRQCSEHCLDFDHLRNSWRPTEN